MVAWARQVLVVGLVPQQWTDVFLQLNNALCGLPSVSLPRSIFLTCPRVASLISSAQIEGMHSCIHAQEDVVLLLSSDGIGRCDGYGSGAA